MMSSMEGRQNLGGEQKSAAKAASGGPDALVPKTKVSLRQLLLRKNWNLKTRLVDCELEIEIETQKRRVFRARCGLGLEGLRELEQRFDAATGRVGPVSPSEVGITDKWRAQVSGMESYDEIDLWMDHKAREQYEALDEYGFFEYDWEREEVEASFSDFLADEGFVGRVKVMSAREGAYLSSLGFQQQEEGVYSNVEDVPERPDIADLVGEFMRDENVAMVIGRRQAVQGDLTPLQALNLDLNTLGETGLKSFVYAGGELRSRTAKSKIGSLFPTDELTLDDFFAQLVNNVAARGSNYVKDFESDRKLALGLLASRKGQIAYSRQSGLYQFRPIMG